MVINKSPEVSRLEVQQAFAKLIPREKLYAHHSARAAWSSAPIILNQTSPESISIFQFILEIYKSCEGNWPELASRVGIEIEELRRFLDYAAVFLGNIGNYFGQGDQKFIPDVSESTLQKLSQCSEIAGSMYEKIERSLRASLPLALGFPSDVAQSSYYPGELRISREEISDVSNILAKLGIDPENTRLRKSIVGQKSCFDVLQSSVEEDSHPQVIHGDSSFLIRVVRGGHKSELSLVCRYLEQAKESAANQLQKSFIAKYQQSFTTGNMENYKNSQREWVKDIMPSVEVFFGFIEPYRDPFGVRAEFEGLVGIVNEEETQNLTALVKNSSTFIRRLPWAENQYENDGKGPFEKEMFESPDFTSLHTLAYCSSIIFPGKNLPNYNDIRQDDGFKNVMITNTMTATNSKSEAMASCLDPSEVSKFLKHREHAFYLWVVFHELLGHGTGKLLVENHSSGFNFDSKNAPINPLTGNPINSWYKHGQTWTGLFGDIATTVDECRAECVGAYLLSDMELLAMFGYNDDTEITGRDLEYNMYMQLGVAGLRALENYNLEDHKWGQAHSRAHFGMFKCLLAAGGDFLAVTHDKSLGKLTVSIDQTKISTHGRPAIASLMLKLHIWRCTADVKNCREYYVDLTEPTGIYLEWRRIMLGKQTAKQVFVQPNTFIRGGEVFLKEYEPTVEGMIQSWAERLIMIREETAK
ncbi:dipeptidyl peptidase III [Stipitochalara longipes BDJ]|nr:dipeptidyl peptidase III [Stipitochalara longipes BDJ]